MELIQHSEAVVRPYTTLVSRSLFGLILVAACGGTDAGGAGEGGDSLGAAGGDSGSMPDGGDGAWPADVPGDVPRAVHVARTTTIPACTVFVDGASAAGGDGSAELPLKTIAAGIAAASDGAIICVAEGTYAEALTPGAKSFTLAGGFQANQLFAVRDSSRYVTKAQGDGANSFLRIEDPGPAGEQLTAIDGFEITGYSQAIYRDVYYSQRFDITNNFIHDNVCAQDGLVGAGFSLNNVSGTIANNVIAKNVCSRGGAGAINDSTNSNSVSIAGNWVDSNVGNEPGISHGGGLYLFANDIVLTANEFTGNFATGWGGGLFVGAFTGGGQHTTARSSWNVYRDNRAGGAGGGFFCDDSARCMSDHEIYEKNCGGNIFLDSGPDGSDPTIATFDHLTNYGARTADCESPGPGVQISKGNTASDSYAFTNSLFWGNASNRDFDASCDVGCDAVTVLVSYSDVQTTYANGGMDITFGEGNMAAVDPLFVDAGAHDFHLQSSHGHWTPDGYVSDAADSPALGAGDPSGAVNDNPERAGDRSELGAFGNSAEASYVR